MSAAAAQRGGTWRYAVIIPACNEAPCIAQVVHGLREALPSERFVIAVGVNGSSDRTAELARAAGALVAETPLRGYGYGCQAAVDVVDALEPVDGYIFFAGDGANDPADIQALVARHAQGAAMVLGVRTRLGANRTAENLPYILANRFFGFLCGCLTGRFFADLGPLRLIDRRLFRAMRLREWTYGWTIEAQIRAVQLRAKIVEVDVREHPRLAGEQKVSRVSWRRTLFIGLKIIAAAWRVRFSARAGSREEAERPPQRRTET